MNKKKFLTLLITFVMLCTSLNFAYAENADVTADAVEETAELLDSDEFRALYAMGFLGEELTITPKDAFITRAQFTGYLFKLAGYNLNEYKASDIPFIDVSIDTPYYNEICTMCEMGIVNGTEPNQFSPNNHVTYAQACKLIVDILGYKKLVSIKYGEYPEGYVSMAAELDINEGVKNVKWDSELTAEDAVTMLYNAGLAEIMAFSGVGENGNVIYQTEGIDLFASNDIYFAQGVIESNGIASINSNEAIYNVTVINDIRYASADVDLTNLLGCKVKYFYRDTDTEKKLLWAYEDTRFNTIIDLKAVDLIIDDASYSQTNIVYYEEDGDKENIKVDEYASVVYNNSFYPIPNDDLMKPKTGRMRLIDINDDEVFDTVIIEEFFNVFIKDITSTPKMIIDKYNNTIAVEDYDLVKIIKDGKEVEFKELAAGIVISCIENKENTKIYIYVMEEKGDSVLESIGKSRNRAVYNFESGSYRLSNTYKKMLDEYKQSQDISSTLAPTVSVSYVVEPKAGMKYKYYLDMAGEIAEIQAPNTGLQYALLMSVREGAEYEEEIVYTRLLLTDGSKVSGVTKKKVKLNGIKQNATNIIAEAKDEKGKFKDQVVQVAFDEEGCLKEINFAENCTDLTEYPYGYNANKFSLDYDGSTYSRVSDGFYMIDYRYVLDNKTVVFYKWSNFDNIGNEPYSVGTRTNVFAGTYSYQVYDAGPDMIPPVVYSTNYYNAEAYWLGVMLVVETDLVFQDGEELRRVSGYIGNDYRTVTELFPGAIPADVEKGDLIRISHYNNRATKVVTEISKEGFLDKTPRLLYGSTPDAVDTRKLVPLYNVSSVGITTINPPDWEARYGKTISSCYKAGQQLLVAVYDTKNDEIYTGDIRDICQFYSPEENGELPNEDELVMVYVKTRYSSLSQIIVVLY